MTAMPLEWHKKNLKNATDYYQKMKERIDQEYKGYITGVEKLLFIQKQISEAEKRGKTKFDADKFMVKRKEK
jgi:hypothetical protein